MYGRSLSIYLNGDKAIPMNSSSSTVQLADSCLGAASDRTAQSRAARPTHSPTTISPTKVSEAVFRTTATTAVAPRPASSRQATLHDPLTGLPNAHLLVAMLSLASRSSAPAPWVVVVQFDALTDVDSCLGPRAAKQMLDQLARRLKGIAPSLGRLARTGEAEFAFLVDGKDRLEVVRAAHHLVALVRRVITLGDHLLLPRPRVGLAGGPEGLETGRQALRCARTAARACDGARQVTLYADELGAEVLRRRSLEAELSLALDRRQLHLEYQPIVSMDSGEISGLEALLRWEHPRLGSIPPDEIIPLAEQTGLIEPIGTWVLNEACRQMAQWQNRYPAARALKLNVNLSARQLDQPDLVELVLTAERSNGLRPGTLKLELTESMLVSNPTAIKQLVNLKKNGIEIQLDDFGSGHSCLGYLSQLPIDALKLDRSFLDEAQMDPRSSAVLDAILSLAGALGLSVTAEGIETSSDADRVRRLACQKGQGFFYYKPLGENSVAELLAA